MKKLIFIVVIGLILTGCTHSITRIGYSVNTSGSSYVNCNIEIKKFETVADSVATKLGEIKLGDSGFSSYCTEADAIVLLKNEGCALKADFINIIEEKRIDIVSSCYRCRAAFYKYNR